jgi:hypothetical protein
MAANRRCARRRGALYVPKLTVQVAFAPIRGGFWAYERYHLDALYRKIFFNDAETIGLYPIASLQSGYGLNVGVRFVHRDVFGEREQLRLRAGTGGQFRQIYSAKLTSGDRLGERAPKLAGDLERPIDVLRIGNGDLTPESPSRRLVPPAAPCDGDRRRAW